MATSSEAFERVWEDEPGILGWLSTVDHKRIGRRYIVTTFAFLLIAGTEALALRTQLARPQLSILTAQSYNQLFTMHGTTMIFLFIMPIVAGFGNYLVPLMIGARDMAFPRLNAFSYWVLLLAGIFMYSSFFLGAAPNGGWFNYVPLTGSEWSAGPNIDFYVLGLTFLGISTTAGAINFIVTIFRLRAPGMSIDRIPLFIWNILIMSFMIVFALPALTTAGVLLFFDRNYGTHFYDPAAGGDPLLWQQLFWFFGHPDVYIFFMPPVGMASMIIPVFSRRPIVGYAVIVAASISIGLISFGVWIHHMFATGLTLMEMSFFTAASVMIALPTAGQYWAWLSMIWHGRPVFTTAFLFALAFLVEFIIGGVTGVMQSVTSFDWQVTDSYFIVAHFHYTIIPSAVLPVMGGIYY
ncbi:MAG TPA: cbb3-type cytochrome c oxidase subunit I, partial [Chloroflexota bacterium]|nr:cbb3-type cytochrome c oxidase subunit I [Chloroflexota bacterium]